MNGKTNSSIGIAVCAFLVFMAGVALADTHDVYPGGSIQAAINDAENGDQIEVAPGVYYEAIIFYGKAVRLYGSSGAAVTTINGTGHYHVVQCINGEGPNTILEGFTITGGNACGISQPDNSGGGMFNYNSSPTVTKCIFTGNRTGNGVNGADSFWYSGGDGSPGGNGAGMYNHQSHPTVTECTFSYNVTGKGGDGGDSTAGLAGGGDGANGGQGAGVCNINSSPEFKHCIFTENQTGAGGECGYPYMVILVGSGGSGAGMYNLNSSPVVTDCEFTRNRTGAGAYGAQEGSGGNGGDGAGMCNSYSLPMITNCTFNENQTGIGGTGRAATTTEWADSYAGGGGKGAGMSNNYSAPVVSQCTFRGNITGNGGRGECGDSTYGEIFGGESNGGAHGGTGGYGAGMYNGNNSSPTVTDCSFFGNVTGNGGNGGNGGNAYGLERGGRGGNGGNGGFGGGMHNEANSNPSLTNCTFTENRTGSGGIRGEPGEGGTGSGSWGTSGSSGGGGIANSSAAPILTHCTMSLNMSDCGGGMANLISNPVITHCIIKQNVAHQDGSGLFNVNSNPTCINCVFQANVAYRNGGGIANYISSPVITNCTFFGNTVSYEGAGFYNLVSNPVITNCILWDSAGKEIYNASSNPQVTTSDVNGGYAGSGNLNADPLFADADGRLSPTSPCTGTGNNGVPNLPNRDLDSNPRITGTNVDMGAYECTELPVRNVTRDLFYDSIQAAIDGASDFDQIRALPKLYMEAIDFKGKAVRLYGSGGAAVTTINGTGHYHVVQCLSGEDPNTILEGFTITGGNANGPNPNDKNGGGMFTYASSPTVIDCIFTSNIAGNGGGMYNENNSMPAIIGTTFTGNNAVYGGGMFNAANSRPAVIRCTFQNNTVTYLGGGMINSFSSPIITNCMFTDNVAWLLAGGGIHNQTSSPIITNCIFSNNTADSVGGGIRNYAGSYPQLINCILWKNFPDQICDLDYPASDSTITYSDVEGGWEGTGNLNVDPLFVNAAGGDYRIFSSLSPCVDAGDNTAANLPDMDLDGGVRIQDGNQDGNDIVDMGAIEFSTRVSNLSKHIFYSTIQYAIEHANPGDTIEVKPGIYYENINFLGKNLVLTSTDPNDSQVTAQTIIDGRLSGSVVTFEGHEGTSCLLNGFTITHGCVNSQNSSHGGGGIYCYQSQPTIRNCIICESLANSWSGSGIYVDTGAPQVIGCTIRNNTAVATQTWAAAVKLENGSALLQNCTIHGNSLVGDGGGVACIDSNLTMVGCFVSENNGATTSSMGGGICFLRGTTVIDNCTIANNSAAGSEGGGIYGGRGNITRCRIVENHALEGGGIYGFRGVIEDCVISGNSASILGGGMSGCSGTIANCFITDNQAPECGGLVACGSIVNCTIINNTSQYSGGGLRECSGIVNCTIVANRAALGSTHGGGGGLAYCTGITNCIIWDNFSKTSGNQVYACSDLSYNCIQDWAGGGTGNIAANPRFVQPGYWADVNDPNIVVTPDDPDAIWMDGFYHLRPESPCIDAGNNSSLPVGIIKDLSGLPRFIESCQANTGSGTPPLVDMGAYEFLPSDIDSLGGVDLHDFSLFAAYWLETDCGDCDGLDLTCDGNVDLNDLQVFATWWLVGK